LLLQKRVEFLLLKELLCIHVDPVLYRVDIDPLFVIVAFFFLLPALFFLPDFFLKASELGHFLLDKLVSLLEVNFKFLDNFGLIFGSLLLL
jgi:hypothetical protein